MLTLVRVESLSTVTRGILLVNSMLFCMTLENPWRDNQHDISCIPEGKYTLIRHSSRRFGETYKFLSVPDRDNIIIHQGNTAEDTRGCVMLGMEVGTLNGNAAVLQSKVAMDRFRNLLISSHGLNKVDIHIMRLSL